MRWIWLLPIVVLGFMLFRGEGVQTPSEAAARINPEGAVILYETEWCGYCRQVERCLTQSKVPFQKRNIEASAQYRSEFRDLGGRGVPLTLVDQQAISGMNGRGIDQALSRLGYQGRCG